MIVETCCVWLTALTLAYSDLHQTAYFTAKGIDEFNPIVKSIVEPKSSGGEIMLGFLSIAGISFAERAQLNGARWPILLESVMILGHSIAVIHNEKHGFQAPAIAFPAVMIRF